MVDLGHGVHLVPDEPDRRRGPGPPRVLTCPQCTATRGFLRVGHPGGDWLCGCGVLFDGDTREWWLWEQRRDQFLARRARGHQAPEAPAATSTNDLPTGGRKESTTT